MKFRIAHLSDCHFAPEVWPSWKELLSKRIVGYVNWRLPIGGGPLARAKHHTMELLDLVFADIMAQKPDHCVLTGDLVNFSLPSEFRSAAEHVRLLGSPENITCIPGNHDAYVPGADTYWGDSLSPWMQGDSPHSSGEKLQFPFVRIRGPLAFIGLSSAIPTHPFGSYGALGQQQLEKAHHILEDLGQKGFVRVVLIHHPPQMGQRFRVRKVLADSHRFKNLLKSVGAELVLHGHTHKASLAYLMPDKPHHYPIPIVGTPSASANYNSPLKRAGYNLIDFSQEDGKKPHWTLSLRTVDTSGCKVHEHSKVSLEIRACDHEGRTL
jgi:3',5'-cyclic AMP phosphodiesterase CpdA